MVITAVSLHSPVTSHLGITYEDGVECREELTRVTSPHPALERSGSPLLSSPPSSGLKDKTHFLHTETGWEKNRLQASVIVLRESTGPNPSSPLIMSLSVL